MRRTPDDPGETGTYAMLAVLACTIGALVFLVDVITIGMSGVAEMSAEERRELDALRKETGSDSPDASGRRLADAELRARAQALRQEIEAAERERGRIAERAESARSEADAMAKRPGRQVHFRIPVEHETSAKPVYFECARDGLAVLSAHYFKMVAGSGRYAGCTILEPTRRPDDPARTDLPAGKALSLVRPEEHFVYFYVRPDATELFRSVRRGLWDRSIEVGWQPLPSGDRLVIGGSGGAAGMTEAQRPQ